MAGFDDPAAGAPARRLRLLFDLFAARADVRGEPVLADEFARVGVVVGAVEGDPLRLLRGRLGPLDRDRLERRASQFEVVAVCAGREDPDRDALALGEEAPFRPFLALSVGFGPVSSPPSGAFPSAPSIASHSHSIPT